MKEKINIKKMTSALRQMPGRVKLLFGVVFLSVFTSILSFSMGWVDASFLSEMVSNPSPTGMTVFVAVAVGMELLWFSRMWTVMAGALLFGPFYGLLLSLLSDNLSAWICFLFARGAGREWVQGLLKKKPKMQNMMGMLSQRREILAIAALRIMPFAHYTFVSYMAGLTNIKARNFFLGNILGLIPSAALYSSFGGNLTNPSSLAFIIPAIIIFMMFALSIVYGAKRLKKR